MLCVYSSRMVKKYRICPIRIEIIHGRHGVVQIYTWAGPLYSYQQEVTSGMSFRSDVFSPGSDVMNVRFLGDDVFRPEVTSEKIG
jgi:hypothetical protein